MTTGEVLCGRKSLMQDPGQLPVSSDRSQWPAISAAGR